jgi:hypothetical protein
MRKLLVPLPENCHMTPIPVTGRDEGRHALDARVMAPLEA